jgi:yecA family protein
MALPLRQETTETAAEIVAALGTARNLQRDLLRRAAERADDIAPAVIDVVEMAARGVFLIPEQFNLLFWGLHAVAAARRTELHRPLLDLLRRVPADDITDLLGGAVQRTLVRMVISTFDGNAEPLLAACADEKVDGELRWTLMNALVRLTFDGRIARETTIAFLDRFEREGLALSGDAAWCGWQDAIVYLGLEEMRERLRATWTDGRNPVEQEAERADLERVMAIAQGLAPGDDTLLSEQGIEALRDVADELEWMTLPRYERFEEEPDPSDPSHIFALRRFEVDWLAQFLRSTKVTPMTMPLDMVDGLFCALVAGPVGSRFSDALPAIWDAVKLADDAPRYDSSEQEQYVLALLRRHWTTIGQRLEAGHPHVPVLSRRSGKIQARNWAVGFSVGMRLRAAEWDLRIGDDTIGAVAAIVLGLTNGRLDALAEEMGAARNDVPGRILPRAMVLLYRAWRGLPVSDDRPEPIEQSVGADVGRKVGRNEPCPCGSGKKYKRCCGSH